jgi:dolichyl-phosphate beta-glucosyltransferase
MDLSIIIPVWNEASKIQTDIINLNSYCKQSGRKTELIIVDDGSTDGTPDKIKALQPRVTLPLKIISLQHYGKGRAVREGVFISSGEIVMFMDCGDNVPVEYIDRGIELISGKGFDMAFGSRNLKESIIKINKPWSRKILSPIFSYLSHIFLGVPGYFTDTQCGFKLFNGDAARILFKKAQLNGFLFDIEIIFWAVHENFKITEFPLEWTNDRDTRLKIFHSILQIVNEFLFLLSIKKITKGNNLR